jgi:hypothetical protein
MRICARCTKDACNNHLCEKCQRCSDCCECEVTRYQAPREPVRMVARAALADIGPIPEPEPEPEPPGPGPDPAPIPTEEPGPAVL